MIQFSELRNWTLIAFSSLLVGTLAIADSKDATPRTLPLKSNGQLSLENIAGDVTIEGWKRNEVSINAVKHGKTGSLDQIKILVEATEDRIDISTEYLEARTEYLQARAEQLEAQGDYLDSRADYMDAQADHLKSLTGFGSIDYTIKVPSGASLDGIELVNGNLTVTGITGRVVLNTVNGAVIATGLANDAEIETVNGKLDVSFDKMGAGQSVDLATVNGAIVLRVPPKASAEVDAETINGDISSEFDLHVEKGQWIGSSMSGQLGSGGASIALETVNGSIDVKKR